MKCEHKNYEAFMIDDWDRSFFWCPQCGAKGEEQFTEDQKNLEIQWTLPLGVS